MTDLLVQQRPLQHQPALAHHVNVYIRLVNSKSFKARIPSEVSLLMLKQTIEALTGISQSRQIIYYRGKNISEKPAVQLLENTIIHVKQSEQQKEEITCNIYTHMPCQNNHFKLNLDAQRLKLCPTQLIGEFLKLNLLKDASDSIESSRTKIIECGRFLKLEKSFEDQNIQSETDIHFILRSPAKKLDIQKVEDERALIASVLKHSQPEQNQYNPEKNPQNKTKLEKQYSQLLNNDKDQCKVHKSDIYGEGNPLSTFDQMTSRKSLPVLPNYCSHTKASGFWQSSKIINKQVTPMRFHLRQYKKYEGPRSVRECNCEVKKDYYSASECEHNNSDCSPIRSNHLRHSAIYGHETKIKSKWPEK